MNDRTNDRKNGVRWKLFFEGDDYFRSLKKEIDHARSTICVEKYIVQEDEIGNEFIELFIRKAREGVSVRLMVDGVGSMNLSKTAIRKMRDAGVEVLIFRPVTLAFFLKLLSNHKRNHRKLIVIDRSVVYIGGMNLKRNHSERAFGVSRWRDTAMRLEGPIGIEAQKTFDRIWYYVQRNRIFFPRGERRRNRYDGFELIENAPFLKRMRNRIFFTKMIRAARHYVHIQTAYFIPGFLMLLQIYRAVKRGVDITILLNRTSDVTAAKWAGRAFYHILLKHGVKIFEYRPRFTHAKTLIVDGRFGIVGSTNIDNRSFIHNLEIDIVTIRKDVCQALEDRFMRDIRDSDQILIDEWKKRPVHYRVLERFYYFFRYYL
jgi:cardiolipin synthase